MTAYTIRIELHSKFYNPDFETLHRAMQSEGFSKFITADNGKTYYLPRGEYYISTLKDCSQVLEAAQRAVRETKETAEILVAKSPEIQWSGLAEKK